ncbi:hypothetical protein [Clostridium saccharobutylicum]|uniref:Uncharacterized protein n=1 Tax=Clostridium saccharobutylicum TaxID=169679 RepID=A0A1S8NHZ0_CLOSA|nr:hypothetical protein [Clostridium saccharobutylicum]OOM15881.1 hypothetical protein CLOSAC_01520 [Clostridium saccharobutylicum]
MKYNFRFEELKYDDGDEDSITKNILLKTLMKIREVLQNCN